MHILDTGPIFKFLTTDCVPQLLAALGHNVVNVPEAVDFEIFDTPMRHKQFKRAAEVWPRFPDRFKNVISDEPTDELRACCRSVFSMDFDDMYASRKDRGENMAILHGVLLARTGKKVILVCDEEAGTAKIKQQASVLKMQHMDAKHVPGGEIRHADTPMLLRWAIEAGAFDSLAVFVKKYQAMASLDSALDPDVKKTGLTGRPPWP
ncbi:hypothetical protein [Sanguibacter antarcticus]|uniref:Uncharacterized protein n=1 Tax=Sanguibacter antarcticus TaxID=372484 RepID=A0A2A9E3W7_9MICO|nr:hypothetical protein [Sanguibacter antarcticus]PFG33648.1 hypothetical protein ATL42_1531 [Sanguibacter antarcticus]